ncbi:hypothetical protein EDB83DRAFT_2378451 [Lactarius deliciosus]|nr:hypothetical protein EDB83DRAFT_2378451 [Lactarius deliciosus]
MSSRNKRSAESEEVSHKKKLRKDDDDDVFDEDDSASDVDDDELEALDQTNVIETGRRTRGIRLDYTKVPDIQDQEDDSGSETEAKGPKKKEQEKGQVATDPRIRSPERKPVTVIEEEKEDDGEEDGQDDDLGDEDDEDEDGDDDDDDEV